MNVISTGTGVLTQVPAAWPINGDLIWFMAIRIAAAPSPSDLQIAFLLDPAGGGGDVTNLIFHGSSGANAFTWKAGNALGVLTLITPVSAAVGVWIHFCMVYRVSDGNQWGYGLLDGFNPASPSFLITPDRGPSVTGAAGRIYTFSDDDGASFKFRGLAAHQGFANNLSAWTQAAVVEQFQHRFPIQYPMAAFFDFNSVTNVGTDLTGNGRNYSVTAGTMAAVSSPPEPSSWTTPSAIRIGSMVARDSSASTADHTVSA